MRTPSPAAERTAPATVFGMSLNFRSRKMEWPRATSGSSTAGPAATNSSSPTLNHWQLGSNWFTRSDGCFCAGHIESHNQPSPRLLHGSNCTGAGAGKKQSSDSAFLVSACLNLNGFRSSAETIGLARARRRSPNPLI